MFWISKPNKKKYVINSYEWIINFLSSSKKFSVARFIKYWYIHAELVRHGIQVIWTIFLYLYFIFFTYLKTVTYDQLLEHEK